MVADPGAPTRGGYVFRGWFTDRTYAREWNFGRDTVNQDTRLYARWEEKPPVTYTVTFDGNGGTLAGPGTVTVREGQRVAEPVDPLLAGNIFSGWFVRGSAAEWNFNTPVDRDITLTARWDLPTLDAIQGRLDRNRSVTVDTVNTVNNEYIIDGPLTVPAGTVLTFQKPVRVAGKGEVTVDGTMNARGGLTNQGTITVNSANTLNVTGELSTKDGGKLAITQSGKVMADTLTGPVNLELGAQVLCKNQNGQIILSRDFNISKKEWSTPDENGYYRLDYIAWKLTSGTLTIGGVGDMLDYADGTPPWAGSTGIIATVRIQDGVTGIGKWAFDDCTALSSVTIPGSVTSIGEGAFDTCSVLEKVTIPESVTSIGDYAFYKCIGLKSVIIPSSVASIGIEAFYGCSSLESVIIPSSVTSIGGGAFYGCSGLTSVIIPEGVKSIGNGAFKNCSSLRSVIIPSSVTSISLNTFYSCSSLESVTISEGVTSIGNFAFYSCSNLESVTIPASVTSIGNSAFSGCSALSSVSIPKGVTSIGNFAFYSCSNLKSVTIPEGVKSIGDSAFLGCSSLKSVTIPSSVTSIGDDAFKDCSLTSITYTGTVEQWNSITKGNSNTDLTNKTVHFTDPDSVLRQQQRQTAPLQGLLSDSTVR